MELMLKAVEDFNKQKTSLHNQIEALNHNPFADNQIKSCYKKLVSNMNRAISKLGKQIKEIMEKEFPDIYKLLKTIPGIGTKTNAAIISILSSFENFPSAKKVTSFLGISPKSI